MIFVSISFSIDNTATKKAPFATIMVMLSSQRRWQKRNLSLLLLIYKIEKHTRRQYILRLE